MQDQKQWILDDFQHRIPYRQRRRDRRKKDSPMKTLRSVLVLFFLARTSDLSVRGQVVSNPFQFDPVEYYGAKFLTWTVLLGLALVVYILIRVVRGHMSGPLFTTLLITAVVVLPLFSLSTGMLLVLDRAERVEFCGSCHLTMKSYVEDMKNPKSEGLAAVHYTNRFIPSNQCYECHTSYGMFGTVEAKMDGTIDVYKYYTRTYKFPLTMRRPYPNDDCLKCHAESAKWLSHEEHSDAKETLFSGAVKCMDCHGVEHPAHPISQ